MGKLIAVHTSDYPRHFGQHRLSPLFSRIWWYAASVQRSICCVQSRWKLCSTEAMSQLNTRIPSGIYRALEANTAWLRLPAFRY